MFIFKLIRFIREHAYRRVTCVGGPCQPSAHFTLTFQWVSLQRRKPSGAHSCKYWQSLRQLSWLGKTFELQGPLLQVSDCEADVSQECQGTDLGSCDVLLPPGTRPSAVAMLHQQVGSLHCLMSGSHLFCFSLDTWRQDLACREKNRFLSCCLLFEPLIQIFTLITLLPSSRCKLWVQLQTPEGLNHRLTAIICIVALDAVILLSVT